jgi:hypothetical protein
MECQTDFHTNPDAVLDFNAPLGVTPQKLDVKVFYKRGRLVVKSSQLVQPGDSNNISNSYTPLRPPVGPSNRLVPLGGIGTRSKPLPLPGVQESPWLMRPPLQSTRVLE